MTLVNVQIEDYELLDMFLDRLSYWDMEDERDLYEKMYQYYMESGCWDGIEFNGLSIVDNDVVNYCSVISKTNHPKDFKKLLKLYKNGEYDVSREDFEDFNASYIEAVSDDNTRILIRH